jgi:hypothetical protein
LGFSCRKNLSRKAQSAPAFLKGLSLRLCARIFSPETGGAHPYQTVGLAQGFTD